MKKLHSVEFISPASDRTDLGFLLSSDRNEEEIKASNRKSIQSQWEGKNAQIDVSSRCTKPFQIQFEKSMLSPSERQISFPDGKFCSSGSNPENDAGCKSGHESVSNDPTPGRTPMRKLSKLFSMVARKKQNKH